MNDRAGAERRLKLQEFRVFMAVVEGGSMSKAAERLATSQPAISRAIGDLEESLGVQLLDRSPQGVVPTPYGMALLKRSVAIFDEIRQGIKDLEFLSDPDAGEVRIAAPIALSTGIVAAAVARMTARHPRIACHLMIEEHTQVFRRLEDRDADLAFVFLSKPIREDVLETQLLYSGRLVIVASKSNPLSRKRRLKLADLVNEPWTLPAPDNEFGMIYAQAFRQVGFDLPPARVVTPAVLWRLALVAKSNFLTVASESNFKFDERYQALVALPIDLGETQISVGIMTLKNRTVTPVAQRFIECAHEVAKGSTAPKSGRTAAGQDPKR